MRGIAMDNLSGSSFIVGWRVDHAPNLSQILLADAQFHEEVECVLAMDEAILCILRKNAFVTCAFLRKQSKRALRH